MGGKAIDLEWLKENAPGMTLDEVAGILGSNKEYLYKLCRRHGIPYISRKHVPPLPKEGITKEWLAAVARFNPQSVAKRVGIGEGELNDAYRRLYGVKKPARVKAPAGGCKVCRVRKECSIDSCECEVEYEWEV